jgi:hypothetical protein
MARLLDDCSWSINIDITSGVMSRGDWGSIIGCTITEDGEAIITVAA